MKWSLDTPVMEKGNQAADVLIAGFLWLLCSLPVVTIGPASAALYYTVVKVVRRKRETVTKAFFYSFRQNLKQGLALTVIYLAYGAVIAAYGCTAVAGYRSGAGMNPYVLAAAGLVLALPWLISIVYIFPVLSRFGEKVARQIIRSLHMALGNPGTTLLLVLLLAACCLLAWFLPFFLVILPGLYAWLSSFLVERIMKKYMEKEREKYPDPDDLPWWLE